MINAVAIPALPLWSPSDSRSWPQLATLRTMKAWVHPLAAMSWQAALDSSQNPATLQLASSDCLPDVLLLQVTSMWAQDSSQPFLRWVTIFL